jgi:hypothetical protein
VRTFSALRKDCNYPEIIDLSVVKTPARRKSMDLGSDFHSVVEAWVTGKPFNALAGEPAAWFRRMQEIWAPPPACRAEVAIGITGEGVAVQVDEPEPHVYVSRSPGVTLITAGRLDLWWEEDGLDVVCDVKTGRLYLGDPWTIPQLVAQAYAVAASPDGPSQIKLGVYYARHGLFDFPLPRTRAEVLEMFPQVRAWALAASDPRPGAHCIGCYSATNCPANPMKAAG